jgi:hypothetical protein
MRTDSQPGGTSPPPTQPASNPRSGTSANPNQADVEIAIDGIPQEYDEPKLKRLLISALEAPGANALSLLGIKFAPRRPDEPATRSVTLSVSTSIKSLLTVAGQPIDCSTGTCKARLSLKMWVLDASAVANEKPQFASGIHLSADNGWDEHFVRLEVPNAYLPNIAMPGQPGRYRLYLPDRAWLRVNISKWRHAQAPYTVTPTSARSRGLRLVKNGNRLDLDVVDDVVDAPAVETRSTGQPPAPANPSQVTTSPVSATQTSDAQAKFHIVLKPDRLLSFDPQRTALRLQSLLGRSRAVVEINGVKSPSKNDKIELTKSRDGLVVWSGDLSSAAGKLTLEPPVPGLTFMSNPTTEVGNPLLVDKQRINPIDQVNVQRLSIEYLFTFDNWFLEIEPFTRIYNQDRPDTSNSECEFALTYANNGVQERLPLIAVAKGGRRILRSALTGNSKLLLARESLQFVAKPQSGSANCAEMNLPLRAFDDGWASTEEPASHEVVGVLSRKVPLKMRGRWLLGLYAPQDIGVNVGSQSGANMEDAKETIFRSLTNFLDAARGQYFQSSSAMNMAVGYDLAAMNSLEPPVPGFPESAVITGQFRNPKPASASLRLDREGDQRYSTFIDRSSTSSAPTFDAVGKMIERYSKLFDLSDERSSVAIYVGATTPTSGSCQQWKAMTENVARLSGKPSVFGIIFTSARSARIQPDLGGAAVAREEVLATRTKAYSCEGANQSTVLFVPFLDLLDRDPSIVLEAAFAKIGNWVAQQSN